MPRAIWKGHLTIEAVSCAVALYAAVSTADRISFHTLNRATGHRVSRRYVDRDTEEPVPSENQVKGYETDPDHYVLLEPEDIASALPDSDKALRIEAFLACADIDKTYFDKPYYLAPATRAATETFDLIREGLRRAESVALARATLFRRVRTVLIRPAGTGLIAHTLSFDYEIRPAEEAFETLGDIPIDDEMLDLAKHIITTKQGRFDPADFTDRYEEALAELIKAKSEGRPIKAPRKSAPPKGLDLLDALRRSAGRETGKSAPKTAPKGRKAG